MYSSPRGSPFSSTTANLSASGSTAKPTSALLLIIPFESPFRFSGRGSVPLLKTPVGSQSSSIISHPNKSNIDGNASAPAPLTESMTTLNFLLLMVSKSTHFKDEHLTECL